MEPGKHEEPSARQQQGDGSDSADEREDVVGRRPPAAGTRYSAWEIHDTVVSSATDELNRPWSALAWSSFAAGLIICFSFLASGFLGALTHDEHLKTALEAVGYPLGFVFVVLGSAQLFTENTLDPILPLLEKPDRRTFSKVARLWGILIAGNMLGTLFVSWVLAVLPVLQDWMVPVLDKVAEHGTSGGFLMTFERAIFGGWLIALAAWLVNTTSDRFAQIVFIWITTMPISAFGFRHSIAGAVEAFYRAIRGGASWSEMVGGFLVPAILGNAVGGVLLVALVFYGQVRADRRKEAKSSVHH